MYCTLFLAQCPVLSSLLPELRTSALEHIEEHLEQLLGEHAPDVHSVKKFHSYVEKNHDDVSDVCVLSNLISYIIITAFSLMRRMAFFTTLIIVRTRVLFSSRLSSSLLLFSLLLFSLLSSSMPPQLVSVIATLLNSFGHGGPVICIIDDLHYLDTHSWDVLAVVAKVRITCS